ncbi:DUF3592 domain-containing protein [Seonamhaeicola sp. MEBiC1930]|uniref:DUF3592 domain-containing protein n=1 Tax=Seonamhaeicola sp. MEBiC01930 TaxID=2976768 RepID=UPI003247BB41
MMGNLGTGILFAFIGVSFVGISIYLLMKYNKVKLSGRKTKGKIIDYEKNQNNDYTYYMPIIEFINEKGKLTRITLSFGEGKPQYKIGSTISITYLKEKEEYDIIINNNSELYLYYAFIFFGLIFSLIGFGLLIKS